MLDGFQGRQVSVCCADFGNKDAYGNELKAYKDPVIVEDVLIAPGNTVDSIEDGRPYADEVIYTLYFPKTTNIEMREALIAIDGEEFDVVGDPRPYPAELVPGSRNLVVKVVRHDG